MKSEEINNFNENNNQRQKEWKNQKQTNSMSQNDKQKNKWKILVSKPLIIIYIIEFLISLRVIISADFEQSIIFIAIKGFMSMIALTIFIVYILFIHEETNTNPPEPPRIQCPYCKSFATGKISTISRGASTIAFGLASSKIGKQWHCNKCNSDF